MIELPTDPKGLAQPCFVALLFVAALSLSASETTEILTAKSRFSTPDRNSIEYPDWEEPSEAVVELGRKLFFDEELSANRTQSCATCHNPDHGFSDGMRFSIGAMGNPVGRNTPHLYNLAWNDSFFWDGRSPTLEDQALGPIKAEGEMNLPIEELERRLNSSADYRSKFEEAFGDPEATASKVATAIASFERSIVVDDTPFDRYLAGDANAISSAAKRGMALYAGKGRCIDCHDGPNFTDNSYRNIGLADADRGRAKIVGDESLSGAFKVPGLRNILYSAPYMHDGSLGTLEEVVRFYDRGGDAPGSELTKLDLTEEEIRDLVAFIGALNQPLAVERPDSAGRPEPEFARSN